jgi:hypothetical protein
MALLCCAVRQRPLRQRIIPCVLGLEESNLQADFYTHTTANGTHHDIGLTSSVGECVVMDSIELQRVPWPRAVLETCVGATSWGSRRRQGRRATRVLILGGPYYFSAARVVFDVPWLAEDAAFYFNYSSYSGSCRLVWENDK